MLSALEPHTQTHTGVREIRDLISGGKAFAVLTPISLIPQIARGCSESDIDEAIAERVNQMTKIVMASTADAWLVHLPGLARRHEIFTAEHLAQDSLNLEDLVTSLQDPEDDCPAGFEDHSLSLFVCSQVSKARACITSPGTLSLLFIGSWRYWRAQKS